MKAIIVEDSRLAREGLKKMLLAHPNIEIIAEAPDADTGEALITELNPDLVFLDINMPGKDGFELLDKLKISPKVIFTTAYSEYAIRSFDFNTVDYLLKPISPERLAKALTKLTEEQDEENSTQKLDEHSQIFIKDGDNTFLVELSKIRRFECVGNYTRLFFDEEKPFIYKSLVKIENRLPEATFFRANRQQIVNLKFVKSLEDTVAGNYVLNLNDGTVVKVSRNQSSRLKTLFSL